MNITILANKDLASNLALNYLVQAIGHRHSLRVLLSARVGKASAQASIPKPLQALRFFEQSLFNEIIFPALDLRQRRAQGKLASFAELAQQGIPLEEINSINCEQGLANMKAGAPALIICIRFGLILKAPLLTIPAYGVINLHSGDLPRYRGVMASFRAMLNGDKHLATSLHYIADGSIDTGQIIANHRMPVNYQASYLANLLALYKGGVQSVVEAVEQIEAQGFAQSYAQVGTGAYYSFPEEADLKAFAAKGLNLFDHAEALTFAKWYF